MLEWDLLSMKLRAAFIRNAVARGIYNVEDIVLDYNEFRKGGPIETPIYEDLPKMLRKAGLDIKVTSGYRPAGTVGTAGLRSWHHRHGAVDIVPQGNTTFEDIENVLHNNPAIRQYMLSHNFGLIDESGRTPESKLTMKKTGATGAHFHIGKDSKYAALYRQRVGAALPEGDKGKTVYFTNPFLPLEQPTQLVLVQRTITPEEILQNVTIPEPIKPDDDIQATVEIPEVEVIGHQPQVNPLTILSLIQESAPTPLVLEPYLIPSILNKVNEIATERNTFLQKDLEDRLLSEERRRRLGYSYRDDDTENTIRLMLFLRNMSANGGSLFEDGGDINYADTLWHENWLNNRQELFNENVSLKPRKFKKLGVDTVEGQINNLRNTEETFDTLHFKEETGNGAPIMYRQYGIGAMAFPKMDSSGNIIWYSPTYSGKPYTPLTKETATPGTTLETIDAWNKKQRYELAPELEVMATKVHERTHALSPFDPANPTNTGLLPLHEKIRRINKEMGLASTKTDGHTSLYDNDEYINDVEETYAGIMQQRFLLGLDPKHHVELEEIQDWRDKGLLNDYLVGKPNEVLYRYFNEVAANDNVQPIAPVYNPLYDTSNNMAAFGGSLSDSDYYDIMERVAKENNEKWNLLRALEGAPLLSIEEEYLRILNDNAYDYRGYYNKYPQSRANADTHWTDEFKTAFHPTFSIESGYSGKKSQYNPNGYLGGVWLKNGLFVPTFWQLNMFGGGGLMPIINVPAVAKNLYNKAKDRLYRTITPQGYHLGRAAKEFIKGDTRDFSKFTPAENEVWARYLGVPYEGGSNFEKAIYSPTKGGATYDDVIKFKDESLILSDDVLRQLLQNQMKTGKNTMLVEGNESGLGTYTLSLGEDENGKYISYYDDWDINPTRGLSAKYKIPLIELIGDVVPESNPFTVYGRRYYTDEDLRRVIER